jgi:integrase
MDATTQETLQETPRRTRRRQRWSWSVGERGETALVFTERNHRLYGQLGGRTGRRAALGYADSPENRERAKVWARAQHKALAEGLVRAGDPTPTVARVCAAFVASRADLDLDESSRAEDERCPKLFARVFGADRDLSKLTLGEWQAFITQRQSGAIDSTGQPVPEPVKPDDVRRRPVGARTVEGDCAWLLKVCNWALEWEDRATGRPLLVTHPLRRERFAAAIPHEQNPRRPIATLDRLDAILAKADAVHSFLAPLLQLVAGTARRISAVLQLRYEDLRLAKTKAAPHGAIRWRGETDKMGREWSAPINATVRAALDALLAARPGLGAAFLFPAPRSGGAKPVDRWLAAKWLEQAERLAEVPHLEQGCWHPYRRMWATARKHLPIQDVAQAGGWKNHAVLATLYQQPDDVTLYRVVSEPSELREAR